MQILQHPRNAGANTELRNATMETVQPDARQNVNHKGQLQVSKLGRSAQFQRALKICRC